MQGTAFYARVPATWCKKLQAARKSLQLPSALAKLDRFGLIILDDLSYVTKDQAETSVLFELIAKRYECKGLLTITANQPFSRTGITSSRTPP
jgi:DNA replication protein DnaC